MLEKGLFCFAFALQIFAWFLAGARFGFRANASSGNFFGRKKKIHKKRYNILLLRRTLLTVGALFVAVYACMIQDYLLLAGQGVLFAVLWFRVAIERN